MTKRELTGEEKHFIEKSINRMQEESDYQKYLLQYAELMLTTGLRMNYQLQQSEYRIKKREAAQNLTALMQQIQALKIQLEEGVELKQKTSEVE
ncbi:MAG: hypothetical protein A2Z57_07070 [Planctomycetes bacterium RIFCSPHIGHO2_12_39_6]|nr:MAG: hypothetical protein A2Z57_07070 [Planctomycetes bacterium RIFCSPHIGHO2_12_39_6]